MALKPRVFISYARSDGSEYAGRLRTRLQCEHPEITLWQDVIGERAGRDWWLQITEALNQVEHMVLVMTPAAMHAENVRKEWRYARQMGVCVIPVQGAPQLDFASLPRWMRDKQFADLGVPEQWTLFITDLTGPCQTSRVPFMVEDLPKNFVPRPAELARLISLLRDEKHDEPVAITAALQGAGGYGKTTVARAVCHDERIQEAFDDGILWVTLGENPGDLRTKVLDLIEVLSGTRPGFGTLEAAGCRFAELLADRDILIVIDDAWNAAHVVPFLKGGQRCARLITTRNLETLPPGTQKVNVDAMRLDEALQLVGAGLQSGHEDALRRLASRLGKWPLLLRLVNGVLRDRVENAGQSLSDALAFVNADLDENSLTTFDAESPLQRDQAVAATLEVSLGQLGDERPRYEELAIFPEDVDVPLSTLERFWNETGNLTKVYTEKLCQRLHDLSLLLHFDLAARTVRLHDVIRGYIARSLGSARVLHAKLVDAWGDLHNLPDAYAWQWVACHLVLAGRGQQLEKLLLDFDWMQAKLEATSVSALIADYDLALSLFPLVPTIQSAMPDTRPLIRSSASFVQSALRLSAHVLAHDKTQLASQLLGRLPRGVTSSSERAAAPARRRARSQPLLAEIIAAIEYMLERGKRWKGAPWLRPLSATLTAPTGWLVQMLVGHADSVTAVAVAPDGTQAISASADHTLKVWDLESGRELRTLEGHTKMVTAVAVTPDWKLAISGSWDGTVKVWEVGTGRELRTLEGHTGVVSAVAVTPDGKLAISGSWDRTVKVWEVGTGRESRTLEGHTNMVSAVAVTPDGKLVISGSWDRMLKVWKVATGREVRKLVGHVTSVKAVAVTPDGKLAITACEFMLKVWEVRTGREVRELTSPTLDPTEASRSRKRKFAAVERLYSEWLFASRELRTEEVRVTAWAVAPDGKLAVSGSADGTVKAWEVLRAGEPRILACQAGGVCGVAITQDSALAISASEDRALRVWDVGSCRLVRKLPEHRSRVNAVAATPDGRLVISASSDSTLRIWNGRTGRVLRTLQGHTTWVTAVTLTPDGKLAISGSDGGTLKVWEVESGRELRTLEGHTKMVTAVAVTPDGKLAISGSEDMRLKVWEVATGRAVWTRGLWTRAELWMRKLIKIGIPDVRWLDPLVAKGALVAVTPDGRLAILARGATLKAWEIETGRAVWTRYLSSHRIDINNIMGISPDGRLAISIERDNAMEVWDVQSGRKVRKLTDHPCLPDPELEKQWSLSPGSGITTGLLRRGPHEVRALAVKPDRTMAISAKDDTLKLWDLETGTLVTAFTCDAAPLCCTFVGTRRIVAGDARGRVHFLSLEPNDDA